MNLIKGTTGGSSKWEDSYNWYNAILANQKQRIHGVISNCLLNCNNNVQHFFLCWYEINMSSYQLSRWIIRSYTPRQCSNFSQGQPWFANYRSFWFNFWEAIICFIEWKSGRKYPFVTMFWRHDPSVNQKRDKHPLQTKTAK